MPNSKTYLNVPYAQKDAAKALGAKWDATKKKWYATSDLDITLFKKWNSEPSSTTSNKTKSHVSTKKSLQGVVTHAKDKNFVAYDGNQPPWN